MDEKTTQIMQNIKNTISDLTKEYVFSPDNDKPITFKGDFSEIETIKRTPNEKERIEYIQSKLRYLYFYKSKLNRNQYKTAMRQCINDRESVLIFIDKIDDKNNIFKDYYHYCNTEQIYMYIRRKIQFPQNIKGVVGLIK